MLRRYLILNGISTVALYAVIWAIAPLAIGGVTALVGNFDLTALEHQWLGPVIHGVLTTISGA